MGPPLVPGYLPYKNTGDHVSASSTSSYAHSIASSSFTLSSGTTDNSSVSSALFYRKPRPESGNNAFAVQLKKLYRSISDLESKILSEDTDDNPDESRVLLHPRAREMSDEELEQKKWLKLMTDQAVSRSCHLITHLLILLGHPIASPT